MLSKQEYQEYSDFMKEVNPEYHKQYIDEIRAALKPERVITIHNKHHRQFVLIIFFLI